MNKTDEPARTALYCRLSREDGDRMESDSISGQKALLQEYLSHRPELGPAEYYIDDGYTGTNFDRPAFRHMEADINAGHIGCVIVKDLSRFGRDYIETGRYLERWLPERGVRFIAVNDNVDSERGAYDMLLPVKNVFNAQYAKDISLKVRSTLHAKQRRGEFIGAFAPYGYRKDPNNRGGLIPDPAAAQTVCRVFSLYESGIGKIRIAKMLNAEGIPSPSAYKRLTGERYHNGKRLEHTDYWTYATINRMLSCRTYAGTMEQGRDTRVQMHGKARRLERSLWTVVPDTHEALISPEQYARVQDLLHRRGYMPAFKQNLGLFAGYLKCGNCGRAMVKSVSGGSIRYVCGSYKRYGAGTCSPHSISHCLLEQTVLSDLNRLLASVPNLRALAAAEPSRPPPADGQAERRQLEPALERTRRLGQRAYEDYAEGILRKEDYLRYQADYSAQEVMLSARLEQLSTNEKHTPEAESPWLQALLDKGQLDCLDRITVSEMVREIRIFQDNIEIDYQFSEELAPLLNNGVF